MPGYRRVELQFALNEAHAENEEESAGGGGDQPGEGAQPELVARAQQVADCVDDYVLAIASCGAGTEEGDPQDQLPGDVDRPGDRAEVKASRDNRCDADANEGEEDGDEKALYLTVQVTLGLVAEKLTAAGEL